MILERQIERQISDAIAPEMDGLYISRAWDVADAGNVKGDEASDAGAVLSVTVSPRVMPDYGGGVDEVEADFQVAVACSLSADADPTGERLNDIWSHVAAKVWAWVRNQTAEQETELTVRDGGRVIFTPGGVMSNGGTAPTWVGQAHLWTWSIYFTVKGIITE